MKQTTQTTEVRKIDFTRILNAPNGCRRYVCHFFNFLNQSEVDSFGMDNHETLYNLALRRAKTLRGKKFHNKQYGGGVVFTLGAKNLDELNKDIIDLNNTL